MGWRVLLLVGMAVTMIPMGCGGTGASPATSSTHTITGTILLHGPGAFTGPQEDGASCSGSGGYTDIAAGTTVTVGDAADKLIGTGTLGGGQVVVAVVGCQFAFSVGNVPDEAFYKVTISHRGALSYSKADLAAKNWIVDATLGN